MPIGYSVANGGYRHAVRPSAIQCRSDADACGTEALMILPAVAV
jgi:hypothetical protein